MSLTKHIKRWREIVIVLVMELCGQRYGLDSAKPLTGVGLQSKRNSFVRVLSVLKIFYVITRCRKLDLNLHTGRVLPTVQQPVMTVPPGHRTLTASATRQKDAFKREAGERDESESG